MKKNNLSILINSTKKTLIKHSPEILTGIGIIGMVGAAVMAVKDTPRALDLLEEIQQNHKNDEDKKPMYKDVLTKVVPVYAPSVIMGGMSIACIAGASYVNTKRNMALATAYGISETALREYREKVIETIGEKKEKTITDAIAKDKIDSNPVQTNEVYITGAGTTLCYDQWSGRYFMSDIEKLKRIENILNKRLMQENYISLNELYYELGLRCTEQGNMLGWNLDSGLIEFSFSSCLTEDQRPCLVIGYLVGPRYNFSDLY